MLVPKTMAGGKNGKEEEDSVIFNSLGVKTLAQRAGEEFGPAFSSSKQSFIMSKP